jgi:hypothetical protein
LTLSNDSVKDSQQNNALHIAAFNGNYLALKSLLENGFNHFKSRNKDGLTPLQAAAISNYIKAQNVLIEHGANAESLKTLSFYGNHADEGDTIDGVSGKVPLRVHRTKFNATEHRAVYSREMATKALPYQRRLREVGDTKRNPRLISTFARLTSAKV